MNKKTKKKKYRSRKGKLYKLSKYKNKEIWRKASKKDVKCNDYLQKKIKTNLSEYKKGKYKSPKQAIAVSYTQTSKKYPRCELVRRD